MLIIDASNMIVAALARYCNEIGGDVWTVEGACITRRKTANRSGVTADAASYRYLIEHPEQGWSLSFRAVWRDGLLMANTATHTTVEHYYDDADIGDRESVQEIANDWLRSLPL